MYCDKLMNITDNNESGLYDIDIVVIKKLDKFIKEKTTLREREKLNPYKFSIEMKIKQETSIMSFVIGSKVKLFEPRFYYYCYCHEQFEVIDVNQKVECTCGKVIIPNEEKDKLYLYFRLSEKPTPCDWPKKDLVFPIDFLEDEQHSEGNFSLADLDEIAGRGAGEDLISLKSNRDEMFKDFLESDEGM